MQASCAYMYVHALRSRANAANQDDHKKGMLGFLSVFPPAMLMRGCQSSAAISKLFCTFFTLKLN